MKAGTTYTDRNRIRRMAEAGMSAGEISTKLNIVLQSVKGAMPKREKAPEVSVAPGPAKKVAQKKVTKKKVAAKPAPSKASEPQEGPIDLGETNGSFA